MRIITTDDENYFIDSSNTVHHKKDHIIFLCYNKVNYVNVYTATIDGWVYMLTLEEFITYNKSTWCFISKIRLLNKVTVLYNKCSKTYCTISNMIKLITTSIICAILYDNCELHYYNKDGNGIIPNVSSMKLYCIKSVIWYISNNQFYSFDYHTLHVIKMSYVINISNNNIIITTDGFYYYKLIDILKVPITSQIYKNKFNMFALNDGILYNARNMGNIVCDIHIIDIYCVQWLNEYYHCCFNIYARTVNYECIKIHKNDEEYEWQEHCGQIECNFGTVDVIHRCIIPKLGGEIIHNVKKYIAYNDDMLILYPCNNRQFNKNARN